MSDHINKSIERERRRMKYQYEIDLLVRGLKVKDIVLLSSLMGNKCKKTLIYELKKEFIDAVWK